MTIQWPRHSGDLQLARDEVHVWAAPLSVEANLREAFARTLSADELARAKRFKFEKHRNRFIAGRGELREVLTRYLRIKPECLRFEYSATGKPGFAAGLESGGIYFNLAHSEDLALIAVTRIGPVGVDVEYVRELKDMDQLVARFFSARENERFQKVAANEKPAAFFNLWTRKEALLKATGEGITRSLSLVEVSFLAGETAKLVAVAGDVEKAKEWSLKELAPAVGFVGAVTVRNSQINIKRFATR